MHVSFKALLIPSCFMLALAAAALAKSPSAITPGHHVLEGPEVSIYNIAGEMRVVEGSGRSVEVEITPGGKDGGRLTVDLDNVKGVPTLRVVYPEDHIVYRDSYGPPHGISSNSYLGYGGRRIHVSGSGPGLEAHADIRVLVPRGKKVNLHLAVGRAFLNDVEGELRFKGASSSVQAERVSGLLGCDVGSGEISISRCKANISADTGSGDIHLTEVNGNVSADAGSGSIDLKRIFAETITLDAGSGSIDGSDIQVTVINADCGSGSINLDGTSAEKMALDAGSGSVELHLTKNVDDLAIEAGSGSVRLTAPRELSAQFRIECPRRNLHIDFPAE